MISEKEINDKAVAIIKDLQADFNHNICLSGGDVITDIEGGRVSGYNIYGGVFDMPAWGVLYCLIHQLGDYLGTTKDERDILEVLVFNKYVVQ